MTEPIEVVVKRYRCPHCRKSWAHKATAAKHMQLCFADPARRTCKTCKHDVPAAFGWGHMDDYEPRHCAEGHKQGPSCVGCGEHPEVCRCSVILAAANQLRVLCPAWEAS